MKEKMKEVYEAVTTSGEASLSFEIEGKTYIRRFCRKERLILLGAGHIAQPVCRYASDMGFLVTVVDDRPEVANHQRFPEASEVICDAFENAIEKLSVDGADYVVVITRGHRYDADCIRKLLSDGIFPKYLGMIGSRRRVISLMKLLEEEGFSREALDRIHAPIGIDINAMTIGEIAISITAELIRCRREGVKCQSGETMLVAEDVNLTLLENIAFDDMPKALLLVYETSGSTPVKSGAMMTVDKARRTLGTIGGGCSEGSILRNAWSMIGSGGERSVTIDMSNDVAEEEGMVCGGRMKVLIRDIGQDSVRSCPQELKG